MPTIEIDVAAQADDCYDLNGGAGWSLTSTRFNAGAYDVANDEYISGARFLNVAIPNGATIVASYLRLQSSQVFSGIDCRTTIKGEANDTPATFSNYANYMARVRTDAIVNWNISEIWSVSGFYNSPSLNTVIQELVDRGGWVSGGDLVLFWENNNSPTGANNLRKAGSFDHPTRAAPRLHIEFTTAITVEAVITLDNVAVIGQEAQADVLVSRSENSLSVISDLSQKDTQSIIDLNSIMSIAEQVQGDVQSGLNLDSIAALQTVTQLIGQAILTLDSVSAVTLVAIITAIMTPDKRTLKVFAEDRTLKVYKENRELKIGLENRTININKSGRTIYEN